MQSTAGSIQVGWSKRIELIALTEAADRLPRTFLAAGQSLPVLPFAWQLRSKLWQQGHQKLSQCSIAVFLGL